MPYEITWEPHGACRRFWGFVTSVDIRDSFKVLHEYPGYDRLLYILHDHLEMTGRDWHRHDVTLLGANHLGASLSNKKLQDIVVTKDDAFITMLSTLPVATLLPNPIEFFSSLAEGKARVNEILRQHNVPEVEMTR